MILHICTRQSWEEAAVADEYTGDTLATEGFIHCSTPEQVVEVANYMFKGTPRLLLLVIDESKVKNELKYEDAGNGKLYPHIYGSLNLDAVLRAVDFNPGSDGTFVLPSLE